MRRSIVLSLIMLLTVLPLVRAQDGPDEGKNWVKVPAVGDGLCVHNLFQSDMVIQRDKPVRVWGWAAPGEKGTVSFAGQTLSAEADKERSWQVTLTAMKVSTTPQTMTLKGRDKTLTLENILIGDTTVICK